MAIKVIRNTDTGEILNLIEIEEGVSPLLDDYEECIVPPTDINGQVEIGDIYDSETQTITRVGRPSDATLTSKLQDRFFGEQSDDVLTLEELTAIIKAMAGLLSPDDLFLSSE